MKKLTFTAGFILLLSLVYVSTAMAQNRSSQNVTYQNLSGAWERIIPENRIIWVFIGQTFVIYNNNETVTHGVIFIENGNVTMLIADEGITYLSWDLSLNAEGLTISSELNPFFSGVYKKINFTDEFTPDKKLTGAWVDKDGTVMRFGNFGGYQYSFGKSQSTPTGFSLYWSGVEVPKDTSWIKSNHPAFANRTNFFVINIGGSGDYIEVAYEVTGNNLTIYFDGSNEVVTYRKM